VKHDFFISFAEEDQPFVESLIKILAQRGLTSWVFYREIQGAKDWTDSIVEGVKNSRTALLIASTNAFSSKHVHREITLADKAGLPLICVLIEKVDLPPNYDYFFVDLQHIKGYKLTDEQIADELFKVIQGLGGIPTREVQPGIKTPLLQPDSQAELIQHSIQSIPVEFVHIPAGLVEPKAGLNEQHKPASHIQNCFWLSRQPVSCSLFAAYLANQNRPLPANLRDSTQLNKPMLVVELSIACGKIHYKEPEEDSTNPHLAAQPAPPQQSWLPAFTWEPHTPILQNHLPGAPALQPTTPAAFHLLYEQPMDCLKPGDVVFERFEVQRQIASGSMGSVYRVQEISSGQVYALKETRLSLLPDLPGDADRTNPWTATLWKRKEALRLFQSEARILGKLKHANLPTVASSFTENDNAYLVMSFIEGKSLKEVIEREKGKGRLLKPDRVISWALQIMDALDYCHQQRILHRDVKPENLLLVPLQDKIYLVDFGLARSIICRNVPAAGTYTYAPPEQFQPNGRLSFSSDVYSLGATLFHLLTLTPPTSAPKRIQGEALIPPKSYNEAISDAFNYAIMKAMELDQVKRFQSMKEFRSALFNQPPLRQRTATLGG
jgi:predicted Ser/Thr protein kinase